MYVVHILGGNRCGNGLTALLSYLIYFDVTLPTTLSLHLVLSFLLVDMLGSELTLSILKHIHVDKKRIPETGWKDTKYVRPWSFTYCILFHMANRNLKDRKNILKMNKEVRMLLPKKDLIQVEYTGKINNYYEDIYIPPYNNTD